MARYLWDKFVLYHSNWIWCSITPIGYGVPSLQLDMVFHHSNWIWCSITPIGYGVPSLQLDMVIPSLQLDMVFHHSNWIWCSITPIGYGVSITPNEYGVKSLQLDIVFHHSNWIWCFHHHIHTQRKLMFNYRKISLTNNDYIYIGIYMSSHCPTRKSISFYIFFLMNIIMCDEE